MTEGAHSNVLSAAFPAPPPFYKHFTAQNSVQLREVRQNAFGDEERQQDSEGQTASLTAIQLAALPRELLYLIPPEPPSSGLYRSFGYQHDISNPLPSLRSRGIEQLYPTPPLSPSPRDDTSTPRFDRVHELTKIARSILLNFLELVGILANDPEQHQAKIADLRTLFLNAHHLINEYRPHQARETVIEMVQAQLAARRAELAGVKRMKEKVDEVLAGLGDAKVEVTLEEQRGDLDAEMETASNRKKREMDRRVWDALDAIEV